MAEVGALTITELTGFQRVVELRGRALPYRPASWAGTMRHKATWYPGNKNATLQVLGPAEEVTSLNGMWKDRFLPGQVRVENAEEVNTAEDLIALLNDIRISGNELRVQWANEVRNGILVMFDANYQRVEDVEWTMEFSWYSRGETRTIRAADQPTELPDIPPLLEAVNSLDDELSLEPSFWDRDIGAELVSSITDFRERASTVFDRVRQVQRLLAVPQQVLGAVASATESVLFEAEDEFQRLLDTPITTVTAANRVVDVLKAEEFRRSMGRSIRNFRKEMQEARRKTEEAASPGTLQVYTVPGDATLRQLSTRFYNTPDEWQLIADVNFLVGSVVPGGTTIIIPTRRPRESDGGTGGNV